MPAIIPENLPAFSQLRQEGLPILARKKYSPAAPRLNFLLLNLMPTKKATERQLIRLLAGTPCRIDIELIHPASYRPGNVDSEHMEKFYSDPAAAMKNDKDYDGLIITGAPVEQMPFEDVDYWQELTGIFQWSRKNVISTLFICWAAQAVLHHRHGLEKYDRNEKLFGVYKHNVIRPHSRLLQGFGEETMLPHSRHTELRRSELEACEEIDILMDSPRAGLHLAASSDLSQVYQLGHFEYEADTLKKEYLRDRRKGLDIDIPENYFPGDDPSRNPQVIWRAHGQLFYNNWIQHIVDKNRQRAGSEPARKLDIHRSEQKAHEQIYQ